MLVGKVVHSRLIEICL